MPFQQTHEPSLKEALDRVSDGRTRLPDFQRNWVWDDDRVVSILATVTLNYPMGVIMTLQTGGVGGRFKTRTLEGVENASAAVEDLLLDGQQRMTSLFQALRSTRPVETRDQRGKNVKRWYYIHIDSAIAENGDREQAIISVPEDRVVHTDFGRKIELDLSTRELEVEQGYFPLNLVFSPELDMWMYKFIAGGTARQERWSRFKAEVLNNLSDFRVPTIRMGMDTPKVAVCTVFEKVNTGGIALNVFELLTATFAGDPDYTEKHGDDFHLPDHWNATRDELSAAYPVLSGLESTDFLQAICLASTYHRKKGAVGCKRKDMLDLELSEYLNWSVPITDALHWAGEFLAGQEVHGAEDLPYRIQLPSLAAIRSVLGKETDSAQAREKLARWYWCGVFGEQYGGTADSRLPRDVEQVVEWIRGGKAPESVRDARFVETRLLTLQTRGSAAYKGIFALLLQQKATDWFYSDKPLTAELLADYKVDIYPIFSKAWCDKNRIDGQKQRSVVNKTLLSHRASRAVASRAPSHYLAVLERESGIQPNWLNDALSSHFASPAAMRADDFERFFELRSAKIVALIEAAMGQRAMRAEETG